MLGCSKIVSGALCDDEGDVVVLLAGAEGLDLVDGGGEDLRRWKVSGALERGDEAVFAELLFRFVEGFGNAIGVEGEDVARRELAVYGGGVPLLEETEDGCGGVEAIDLSVVAEKDGA